MSVFRLGRRLWFPPVESAEPDGLLAVGGDLSVRRLRLAYASGLFPWFSGGEPIQWWSPDPRFVLFPERLRVSDSLRRVVKSGRFVCTRNRDFRAVIEACATVPRRGQADTWITREMVEAYVRLHAAGDAESVEVWREDALVGGLYGVRSGACFAGESMFARVSDASKAGLVFLVSCLREEGIKVIDCQVRTAHLESLGGESIPRSRFLEFLPAVRR